MSALEILYAVAAIALVLASVLPQMRQTSWVIRMCDIPRLQIAALIAILAVLGMFFDRPPYLVWLLLGAALLLHAFKILPFTPLGQTEVALVPDAPDRLKILASNVLMENEKHAPLVDLIRTEDPDIIFLMETDEIWLAALEPVLRDYPVRVDLPLDNCYGLSFATRLETEEAQAVFLVDDDTPSLLARMISPCGRRFGFVGLHPRPPLPGTDTDERDTQIIYSARFARQEDCPIVTAGDFNAAAWGGTSQRFKYIGEYLDPRRGRGLFSSFDARSKLLRCPIDQLYVTREIAIADFRRGPAIGSDHFPLIAELSLDPASARRANRPLSPLSAPLLEDVTRKVAEYGERLERLRQPGSDDAPRMR